ncbi:MAG: hypothetical protein WC307_01755 [Candidatus Nanoarchaeia archaeon]|jgi:hypothetical protein
MSSKVEVTKTIVKHKGVFNFEQFHKHFYEIISANGYLLKSDAHQQKDKDDGQEIEVNWDFEKEIDDYTKFAISVYYIVTSKKDVVIKRGDKEIKTNTGNAALKITGTLITDWQGNWDKSPILKKLRNFYERYLFKKTFDDYYAQVMGEVFLFENEMKAFFDLS